MAARYGFVDIVRFLVQNKADSNKVLSDKTGVSPLRDSCWAHKTELLVVDFSKHPATGISPVLAAIRTGDHETLRLLVSNGANIETPDKNGTWPLLLGFVPGTPRSQSCSSLISRQTSTSAIIVAFRRFWLRFGPVTARLFGFSSTEGRMLTSAIIVAFRRFWLRFGPVTARLFGYSSSTGLISTRPTIVAFRRFWLRFGSVTARAFSYSSTEGRMLTTRT